MKQFRRRRAGRLVGISVEFDDLLSGCFDVDGAEELALRLHVVDEAVQIPAVGEVGLLEEVLLEREAHGRLVPGVDVDGGSRGNVRRRQRGVVHSVRAEGVVETGGPLTTADVDLSDVLGISGVLGLAPQRLATLQVVPLAWSLVWVFAACG